MKRDPLLTSPRTPAKVELKVVQIGNSRGKKDKRLTWEETYREAAREKEDWSVLDATVADGIEPYQPR